MENIIFGVEFVIGIILGIILGVITIAAVGAIIVTLFIALETLYESITNFLEKRKKANKKNKLNMAKNTETATDNQEMVATNEITFDEIKEAFLSIVEFEYNDAMEWAQDKLSCDITYFDKDELKDEVEYHLERMSECKGIYDHFDEAESFDGDEDSDVSDFWVACNKLNSYLLLYQDVHSLEEFNERYSEIVDADVLQEISKCVFF